MTPQTETRHQPAPGEIYTFWYEKKLCRLCVTLVTETHIHYKFIDCSPDQIQYEPSWRQTIKAWYEDRARNCEKPVTTTKDPAYLHFIPHTIYTREKGM